MKTKNTKTALNKFLSQSGFASRRKSTDYIKEGKVRVNGKIQNKPFYPIDPDIDEVSFDNKSIKSLSRFEYYLINKPVGFVSSTKSDSTGLPPVTSLVRSSQRLHPIGRLDIDSQGLMILTNDGNLTQSLTHPSYETQKHYQVEVLGNVNQAKLTKLEEGINLKEGKTMPCQVDVVSSTGNSTVLEFIISQGLRRQIRRMCVAVDLHVKTLTRTQIKNIKLDGLPLGHFRKLNSQEVASLKSE